MDWEEIAEEIESNDSRQNKTEVKVSEIGSSSSKAKSTNLDDKLNDKKEITRKKTETDSTRQEVRFDKYKKMVRDKGILKYIKEVEKAGEQVEEEKDKIFKST